MNQTIQITEEYRKALSNLDKVYRIWHNKLLSSTVMTWGDVEESQKMVVEIKRLNEILKDESEKVFGRRPTETPYEIK